MTHVPNSTAQNSKPVSLVIPYVLIAGSLGLMGGFALGALMPAQDRLDLRKSLASAGFKGSGQPAPPAASSSTWPEPQAEASKPTLTEAATQVAVTSPKPTHVVRPAYPVLAKDARLEGPVEVKVKLDEKGHPVSVKALEGNEVLKVAALDAARKWRFQPATTDGQAVPSDFKIRFDFKLA